LELPVKNKLTGSLLLLGQPYLPAPPGSTARPRSLIRIIKYALYSSRVAHRKIERYALGSQHRNHVALMLHSLAANI
jgi:hypothetical protein